MIEAVTVLAIGAFALVALSLILARVVPDEYDRTNPGMSLSRQPIRRRDRQG
jgi:hypothetical protein